MDRPDPTEPARVKVDPIEAHERAVIARLLQASCEALQQERIDSGDDRLVLQQLMSTLDRAMIAIRRGQPWVIERLTFELDRDVKALIEAHEQP